ncbi:MAG: filamentous hemagglutinin N-terminal domain-containing protein, partial [Dongiaceae bacterium]
PGASAVVLNRILDQNPSTIYGSISANGQVFLINARGILFAESAQINVGGLLASGLDMSVEDFMAGRYKLAANGLPGAVINHGVIAAAAGGSVALVGGQVVNTGLIRAHYGRVTLAGAEAGYIDFDGDGLMRFEVTGELQQKLEGADAAVTNTGVIQAAGGEVILQAAAARGIFDQLVNNEGRIEAGAISIEGGVVRLVAAGGDVINTGTIVVSSEQEPGGQVHIEAVDGDILSTGTIEATSIAQSGGFVELVSNADTILNGGMVDAGSVEGVGGTIHVLGNRVAVMGPVRLGSTGGIGGGTILIGGDFQGRNPLVRNATRTYVGPDAEIDVSALNSGAGGRVIVWSEEYTAFYGTVSARGPPGGIGGFVEVSSRDVLLFAGSADVGSVGGALGTVLL